MCTSVDEARFNLFCQDLRPVHNLPPTKVCLQLHMAQANCQAAILRHCLQSTNYHLPTIFSSSWQSVIEHDTLMMKMITLPATPDDILLKVPCKCGKLSCQSAQCLCLACTDLCRSETIRMKQNPLMQMWTLTMTVTVMLSEWNTSGNSFLVSNSLVKKNSIHGYFSCII